MSTNSCLCLICGKHIKAAECRSITKSPTNSNVVFLCCLSLGYGLRLDVAKMILKDEKLKSKHSCIKHYIQAAFWLSETNNISKKPGLAYSTLALITIALVERIQKCATFFGDYTVTMQDVRFFFYDCQTRYCTGSGWTVVDAKERKDVAAQAKKFASEKSKRLSVEIKPDLLSVEEIREQLGEGLRNQLTSEVPGTNFMTEGCSKDAYLRKKWGQKFGEQIEVYFVGTDLLEDETYTRLVEVSKSITQYEGRRWTMTSALTQFYINFRKRYYAKSKRFRKQAEEYRLLVQKFVAGCGTDGTMTDPSYLLAQKKLDQESAFLSFLNEPLQLDDRQPFASDPEMPLLTPMHSIAAKGKVCDNTHFDALHRGPHVDDVSHSKHVSNGSDDDGCISRENVKPSATADADEDRSHIKVEAEQEDLSRSDAEMEDDWESIAASSTSAQILGPSSVGSCKDESSLVSLKRLDSDRAQTKSWRRDLMEYNNSLKSLDPNYDVTELHADCVHVPVDEKRKQERFEIISSLAIRNRRAPFLPRLITFAAKRIHFESHKRSASTCTDGLPGQSVLFTIWWSPNGVLYHAFSQEGYSFHSQMMTAPIFMFQLDQVVKSSHFENIREFGPILLCDEPRDYMTTEVVAKLHKYNIEILPYPLGSKDLLPSHYYFFKLFFDYIKGNNYSYLTTLKTDLNNFLCIEPSNFFAVGINELPWRWNSCTSTKGERVEF